MFPKTALFRSLHWWFYSGKFFLAKIPAHITHIFCLNLLSVSLVLMFPSENTWIISYPGWNVPLNIFNVLKIYLAIN